MERLLPKITNGKKILLSSDSVLCDEREPLTVSFPRVSDGFEHFKFVFEKGEVDKPTLELKDEKGQEYFLVKLGSQVGNYLTSKHITPMEIQGKTYYLMFNITKLIGNAVRVEVSVYE